MPLFSTACCVGTTDSYPSMLADSMNAGMQMLLFSTAYCAITTEGCYSTMADMRKACQLSII